MKPRMKSSMSAYLECGKIWIALVEEKIEYSMNEKYNHIAFSVKRKDYCKVVENLKRYGVREWQSNRTEGESFYFLDPSSNKLEIHYSSLDSRINEIKK